MITISEADLAQLRHAYSQLKLGCVINQAVFAEGLLAPIIRKAERQQNAPLRAELT